MKILMSIEFLSTYKRTRGIHHPKTAADHLTELNKATFLTRKRQQGKTLLKIAFFREENY
jgi:hypothetical protein